MENQFETFLLYYFSAIAQVVAAVIALGGVFLVFYIQSLNSSILTGTKKLNNNIEKYFASISMISKNILYPFLNRQKIFTRICL